MIQPGDIVRVVHSYFPQLVGAVTRVDREFEGHWCLQGIAGIAFAPDCLQKINPDLSVRGSWDQVERAIGWRPEKV